MNTTEPRMNPTEPRMNPIEAKYYIGVEVGRDTNGEKQYLNTFPLHTNGGEILSDIPERLLVSGVDAFHRDIVVATTKTEIEGYMMMSKDEAKVVFPNVWNAIKNADTDELYRHGGKAWSNFCSDIIIYYVCRLKLFNTPIPTIQDDYLLEKTNEMRKNKKRKTTYGTK